MTIVLDVNQLVSALDTAVTAAGIPFGDSNRPTDVVQDQPYVVAFFDGGRIFDRTLVGRDGVELSLTLSTYAWAPDSVRVGRRKAVNAVFGLARTTVGTWRVHTPVHSAALAIEREDKLTPPLYWQTDDFTILLTPA